LLKKIDSAKKWGGDKLADAKEALTGKNKKAATEYFSKLSSGENVLDNALNKLFDKSTQLYANDLGVKDDKIKNIISEKAKTIVDKFSEALEKTNDKEMQKFAKATNAVDQGKMEDLIAKRMLNDQEFRDAYRDYVKNPTAENSSILDAQIDKFANKLSNNENKNVYQEIAGLVRAEKEDGKNLGTDYKVQREIERIGQMFDKAGVKLDQHNVKEEAKAAKSADQTPKINNRDSDIIHL